MSGSAQYREFQPDHAVIYSASFVLPSLSLSDVDTQLHYLSHFGVPTEGFTAQPAFQASYEIDLLGRNRAQAEAAAKKTSAAQAQEMRRCFRSGSDGDRICYTAGV